MSRFPDSEPRRYLIAIGSPSCPNMNGCPELGQVKHDVERITTLFEAQGYERVNRIRLGSTASAIKCALSDWFSSSEREESDCVVIYYAGHGDEGGRFGDHYLFTVESHEDDLLNTAIETRSLIKSFFQNNKRQSPQNVLLILDVCYAGKGQRQSLEEVSRLREGNSMVSDFWIIASSDATTLAGDGAFIEALEAVLQNDSEEHQRGDEFLSLDFLVERINQHPKMSGQGQKAIASGAEIQKQAIFIRNPRFVCPRNLFAPVDQLLPLLKQIEQKRLDAAYRQCYPESIDRPLPRSIEALLLNLIQLPQGVEERLPKFVSLLARDELVLERYQPLVNWGKIHCAGFEAVLFQSKSSASVAPEFYLMIYVSENRQFRGRYTVQVCLPEATSTTLFTSNDESVPLSTTLSTQSDKDISVVVEEVPEIIAKLVDEVSRKGVAIKNLSIQCFLPRPLLSMPIDQIEIAVDGKNQKIGSLCKTVVVRSTERQTRSATAGNWEERWRNYEGRKNIGCQDALILHEGDLEEFYEALEEDAKVGCCFEGLDDSDDQDVMFDEMFLAGIPIALWLRPGHALPDSRGVLQSLLDGYIEQLPASLTRNRRKDRRDQSAQAKITYHVTLLWDNPFQPFPNDDWTGRSA